MKLTPAQARLPMKSDAASRELSCNACHAAHRFEVQAAAVQDCMTCHNDKHTLAYIGSPHHKLWEKEIKHEAPPNSGVNCATCHLPRATHKEGDLNRVLVEHNQNGNLRPNSKMIRSVCANCHGLAFSIDALADSALVANNFRGQPAQHVKSIEMAETSQHRSKSSSEKSAQPKP